MFIIRVWKPQHYSQSVYVMHYFTQCGQKVAVHLSDGRVQLNSDGTRWRTGWEVWKVAVHL